MTSLNLDRADEIVGWLLSWDGFEIQEFRKLAFDHLLPGLSSFYSQDPNVSYGGYTADMNVLWIISTQEREIIGIRYAPRTIDKDGIVLSRIRGADFTIFLSSTGFLPTTLFERDVYIP